MQALHRVTVNIGISKKPLHRWFISASREPHYHNVNMGHASCIATPRKGTMRE